MGGSPPPHGISVGTFKVVHKENSHGVFVITLAGEHGTCIFRLSPEDAQYFVEGETYLINATQP